jgi:beta-aspartyl-peptidase (threonine type)
LLAHGGAGRWPERHHRAALQGLREAVTLGWQSLAAGASALEAVEQAVMALEDNPLFDAGAGSFLNDQGEVEMDALIVDGREIRFGAVAAVRRVRHPIRLARLVLTRTNNCFFVGDGADRLAAELGMPLVANIELVTATQLRAFRSRASSPTSESPTGTVGAVALDVFGHVASATSTGGIPNKRKGRVGDTPIFGAGGYADDRLGAASATGVGEHIVRFMLCKHAVDRLVDSVPAEVAAAAAVDYMRSRLDAPEVGIIVLDKHGRLGAAHTTPAMPVAWVDAHGKLQASIKGGVTTPASE